MQLRLITLTMMCMAIAGCGPSEKSRLKTFYAKEASIVERYAGGDIRAAKQAAIDYLRLLDEGESAHLSVPIGAWEEGRGLCKARLSMISQQLGDQEAAQQYMQQAVR
jgi:hypothetical protein